MTYRTEILARLAPGADPSPLYLPDLTLWYNWHQGRNSLPDNWQGWSLPQVARAMGVPIWMPFRPWHVETPGVRVEMVEAQDSRTTTWETPAGTLTSRWTIGPDGDWWQSELPVKSAADLEAALAYARARTYVLDDAELEARLAQVGEDGVLALTIPRRPYSDLLHDYLGWAEGLFYLAEPEIQGILAALDASLKAIVEQVASVPGDVILSPDNLDGQYISPRTFDQHLGPSYARTAEIAHRHGKPLVVHVGGPIRHLLAPLSRCGIDALEGIAGPPQGDLSLAQAREVAGPDLTLWGGIPQDLLLDTHDQATFESGVRAAALESARDARVLVGVADRVPVDANTSRLLAIPHLLAGQ